MRTCRDCGLEKPDDSFYQDKGRKRNSFASYCKPCHGKRASMYGAKRRYGLTAVEYRALKEAGCAVCGSHERPCIDHDHKTGRVRAILCHNCNLALGHTKDDPDRLRALAEYLESF